MAKFKRTPPNKPKPETCEVPGCKESPTCVLGGFWFCKKHGNRDYERKEMNELGLPWEQMEERPTIAKTKLKANAGCGNAYGGFGGVGKNSANLCRFAVKAANEYHTLKAENERLRGTLNKIKEETKGKNFANKAVCLQVLASVAWIAKDALKEK